MGIEAPAILLLALPLGILYARQLRPRRARPLQRALHAGLLLLLVLALGGPYLVKRTRSIDLILVVDRSRSMPPGSDDRFKEILVLVDRQRAPGTRLGVVSVGAEAHVEMMPDAAGKFAGFAKEVDPDASNLADGIETAVNLVGADRAGKILVLSDGLPTGRSPLGAASRAAARGVAVDYRLLQRPVGDDLAVDRISLPAETDAGASFQWSAWIRSGRDRKVKYRCFRDDALVAEGETAVKAGSRPLQFRDRLPMQGGLHRYRVELLDPEDPTPENNTAVAVLRAHDAPRVLVASSRADEDNLLRTLRATGFRADHAPPGRFPRDAAGLDPYRGVILHDVAAQDVGARMLRSLRAFVEEGGGGLLMTGGRSSFGPGGYFKSDLDPILPVSMEMRQEQRRFRMAMAIVLDRSGSMMAPVGGGLMKMDLANRGSAEAVGMLTAGDEVAVIAVDSSAHMMVPLTKVTDPASIQSKVLRIRSEGGGIFVYTGLIAGGAALEKSTAATRHIVLFADAADAEEPGSYRDLLAKFKKAGITVSVIGMGTDKDTDAEFLKDVARLGNGRIFFSDRPADLPRLFAQETLAVARSSFVDEPVGAKWLPDAHLLGEAARTPLPVMGGYSLTYARPQAAVAAVTQDDQRAPLLAFWHRGVGRVAAFTPEADGPTSKALLDWPGYGALFAGMGRWLLGAAEPQGISVSRRVEEPDVLYTLEFDPDSEAGKQVLKQAPTLHVLSNREDEETHALPFQWTGERALEARFTMKRHGIYLPVVRLADGTTIKAAPVTLPYSPEFLPRRGARSEGEALLDEIAARTGGRRRDTLENIFEADQTPVSERMPLRTPLALAALLLLLLDVAARRLHLWDLAVVGRVERALAAALPSVAPHPMREGGPPVAPPQVRAAGPPEAPPPPPPAPKPEPGISGALDSARKRSRDRFGQR